MSISSISSATPISPPPPAQDSSFRTAMQQLTSAIGSGDVTGAQTAYATLTSLPQASGQANSSGPLGQFLSTVGADLNKGDISSAQSTLTTFKAAHGKHHHHAPPPATATDSDSSSTASSTAATPSTTSSNTIDVSV
jgi:hypothetical protein